MTAGPFLSQVASLDERRREIALYQAMDVARINGNQNLAVADGLVDDAKKFEAFLRGEHHNTDAIDPLDRQTEAGL